MFTLPLRFSVPSEKSTFILKTRRNKYNISMKTGTCIFLGAANLRAIGKHTLCVQFLHVLTNKSHFKAFLISDFLFIQPMY